MTDHLRQNIEAILTERKFCKLIGLKEDLWFEAKPKNEYDLDSPNGRYELAKDVSAIANSEGGHILIGLKTVPVAEERTDKVDTLDLFPEEEISISRYQGIINEYIHPKPKNVVFRWIEDADVSGKGLVSIYIPAQREEHKYFLLTNIIEEDQLIKGIVFGIIIRRHSGNIPFTVDQMWQAIRKGMQPTLSRLIRIEDKIDALAESSLGSQGVSVKDKLPDRINRIASNE